MSPPKVYSQLKEWLNNANRVVIAGIGNPIRSDDYVGTKIAKQLEGKLSKNVQLRGVGVIG